LNRFFIVSTPRTGNVFMRRVLTDVLGLPNVAVWVPGEAHWDQFPADVSLAMHWRYSREFEGFLREAGFRIAVTARHPLDVLLSILHYAPTDPETNRWLEVRRAARGEHGVGAAGRRDPALRRFRARCAW
jgi:hypothetical protein